MPISDADKALVRLFMTACFHQWEDLPDCARVCYQAGCSLQEVRGCIRHVIVVAGYAPCLAATINLHHAKLLEGDTPGKVGGHPGDAFDCVYTSVADPVRTNMHEVDPVLTEYIRPEPWQDFGPMKARKLRRLHLYGDIYSSPGISLRQKQLLMCAFLGEANMPEQLFGHLLAGFRFGNETEALLKAIDIGFEKSPKPRDEVYKGCLKTLEMAYRKFKRDFPDGPPPLPEVHIPEPQAVRIPDLHLKDTASQLGLEAAAQQP